MQQLLRLLQYTVPWKFKIVRATIYSSLNKLFDIAPEILIGVAVDLVVKRQDSFIASMGFADPIAQLTVLGFATFLVWSLESFFEYLYQIDWRNLAQAIQHSLRLDAYDHVQRAKLSTLENQKTGNMLAVLTDDINQLERFLDKGANEIIQIVVSTLLIGAVFLYISPQIAVLALLPVPIILLIAKYFQKSLAPRYLDVRNNAGQLATAISNNLLGLLTIKSFVAEPFEKKRIQLLSDKYAKANNQAIRVSSAFNPIIRIAVLAGFLFTLILGGYRALSDELSAGSYSVLVFLTQRFLWPFTSFGEIVDSYERAMASTKRILDTFLLAKEEIGEPNGSEYQIEGALEFQDVTFSYSDGKPALQNLNLRIDRNQFVAIVGPSGCGKTSAINLILRFYPNFTGNITIDGVNINNIPLANLREKIALVNQDPYLFEGSIRENILYPGQKDDPEKLKSVLRDAQLKKVVSDLPEGVDTIIRERGGGLSGGQRQRIAIARALYKDAPIIIFDEATSSVDNKTEEAIRESIEKIVSKKTLLLIAHRLSTVRYADNILVMNQGQVVQSGKHEELIKRDGLYKELWQSQLH